MIGARPRIDTVFGLGDGGVVFQPSHQAHPRAGPRVQGGHGVREPGKEGMCLPLGEGVGRGQEAGNGALASFLHCYLPSREVLAANSSHRDSVLDESDYLTVSICFIHEGRAERNSVCRNLYRMITITVRGLGPLMRGDRQDGLVRGASEAA